MSRIKQALAAVLTFTLAAVGLGLGVSTAYAKPASEIDHSNYEIPLGDTGHWTILGATKNAFSEGEKYFMFCRVAFAPEPEEREHYTGVGEPITEPNNFSVIPEEYRVTAAQAAYLLKKYNDQVKSDRELQAALSFMVHTNFEDPSRVRWGQSAEQRTKVIWDYSVKHYKPMMERAKKLYREARVSTVKGYKVVDVEGKNTRHGKIKNIGVTNKEGNVYLPNHTIKIKLVGPAVFDETGNASWEGKTKSEPITLHWTATGNGEVRYRTQYEIDKESLYQTKGKEPYQNMVQYNIGDYDPEFRDAPEHTFDVQFDFQPKGESNVGEKKITDDGIVADTLKAFADNSYPNPVWMEIDGSPVPVKYKGTAYFVGENPVNTKSDIPESAKKLGEVTVTANGPGEYNVELPNKVEKRGFVVWKWDMIKSEQEGKVTILDKEFNVSDLIKQDWHEDFAAANETNSYRHDADIDSTLSIRDTKSGKYLVDDVWVSGMPGNHPEFKGSNEFGADVKEITHRLWFFKEGLEVKDENTKSAELIGSVQLPAKNGFYPSVGGLKFKVRDGVKGTYVFQSVFAGDDRVKPLSTSVEDKTEQFVVEGEKEKPVKIHTTATGKNGEKELELTEEAIILDKVMHEGTKPGEKYTLEGVLMDYETKKPLEIDGKAVTPEVVEFTPKAEEGSQNVEFKLPGYKMDGKTVVVFESLYKDGKLIATHRDIEDKGQTVVFRKTNPKIGTTATGENGEKVLEPVGKKKIIDTVKYFDLIPGKEYEMRGELMDPITKKPLVAGNIEGCDLGPVNVKFTPKDVNGELKMEFEVCAGSMAGKSTVVFEDLYKDGKLIASHKDFNDKGQTVSFKDTSDSVLAHTGANAGSLLVSLGMLIAGGATLILRKKFLA